MCRFPEPPLGGYCYLPLYIFCGDYLLAAKLRSSGQDGAAGAKDEVARIVGRIREKWPRVRIILRADSGFCREELMAWCEESGVGYVLGLARNERLQASIEAEMEEARKQSEATGAPARCFKDFAWTTRKSWSRERRVVGKAEHLGAKANPRFVVTSLPPEPGRPARSTRRFTARAARWRTASRNASSTCSPTAPRAMRWPPTNSDCGCIPSPMCCSRR